MTAVERTGTGRLASMLSWLDESVPLRGLGLMRDVRIEDFVEDSTYVIRAEIPGIDPDKDLDVHVEGDMLVVKGERREEKHDKNHQEMHYGSFERTVRLPGGVRVDDIDAQYADGVLTVRAPFETEAPQSRKVQVPVQRSSKKA